jgi:hypothetical protein
MGASCAFLPALAVVAQPKRDRLADEPGPISLALPLALVHLVEFFEHPPVQADRDLAHRVLDRRTTGAALLLFR